MRSTTPVLSNKESTKRMLRFPNGAIFASIASIDSCPICDVIVKKNLLPLLTSLSTHILPVMSATSRFEIDSPRPVPPYSCQRKREYDVVSGERNVTR